MSNYYAKVVIQAKELKLVEEMRMLKKANAYSHLRWALVKEGMSPADAEKRIEELKNCVKKNKNRKVKIK